MTEMQLLRVIVRNQNEIGIALQYLGFGEALTAKDKKQIAECGRSIVERVSRLDLSDEKAPRTGSRAR
jgi:hypothetical protein